MNFSLLPGGLSLSAGSARTEGGHAGTALPSRCPLKGFPRTRPQACPLARWQLQEAVVILLILRFAQCIAEGSMGTMSPVYKRKRRFQEGVGSPGSYGSGVWAGSG